MVAARDSDARSDIHARGARVPLHKLPPPTLGQSAWLMKAHPECDAPQPGPAVDESPDRVCRYWRQPYWLDSATGWWKAECVVSDLLLEYDGSRVSGASVRAIVARFADAVGGRRAHPIAPVRGGRSNLAGHCNKQLQLPRSRPGSLPVDRIHKSGRARVAVATGVAALRQTSPPLVV